MIRATIRSPDFPSPRATWAGACGAVPSGSARPSGAPNRSRRARDGTYIGWGVAVGAYPGMLVSTIVRLTIDRDGGATIALGRHEMGQGMRTVIATATAEDWGCRPGRSPSSWGIPARPLSR